MRTFRGFSIATVLGMLALSVSAAPPGDQSLDQALWDPIHFQPQINEAKNEDCLACHQEILDRRIRDVSPAGVKAEDTLAWYQTLESYDGVQDTFHRRHLETPLAKELMNLQCNTCHQGNDPREETSAGHTTAQNDLVMRKMVDPDICLMCHGQFNYKIMTGLPGPWEQSRDIFQNNCMACHISFRSNRHDVNFLNKDAIEAAGTADGDVCFGCHGGRSWYRTSYPYPRHAWPGMADTIPDWAKDRPTESQARFLNK